MVFIRRKNVHIDFLPLDSNLNEVENESFKLRNILERLSFSQEDSSSSKVIYLNFLLRNYCSNLKILEIKIGFPIQIQPVIMDNLNVLEIHITKFVNF